MNESISVSLFLFLLFSLRSLTLRRGIHHLIVLHDSRIGEQLQALLRQRITMTLLEHTAKRLQKLEIFHVILRSRTTVIDIERTNPVDVLHTVVHHHGSDGITLGCLSQSIISISYRQR